MKMASNGIQLNVTDAGDGDPALVFVHHWGGSSRTWAGVVARLQGRFRCIAIDARGAGDSAVPARGYGTRDHASDVRGVVDALRLPRYVVVGHSMGGKAAQVLAARRPPGLVGIALIASSPPSPMVIDEAQREQMKRAYADRGAVEWSLDNVLLGTAVSTEVREQLIADALRLGPEAVEGWVERGSREDFSDMAADIEVPVLIVAGELDRVDPLAVVKSHLLPHYPSARVELLPGKGHLLPVEAPAEIAAAVGAFAAGLRDGR